MSTNVSLTTELENFARTCVSNGRFSNVSEVVRTALRLLQDKEEKREKFSAMLESVQEEADREGTHSLNKILKEMDEVISRKSQ